MSAPRQTLPRPGAAAGARRQPRPIPVSQFRARAAAEMLEDELLAHVRALARAMGWREYHTHNSRRSTPGFPDLVLVSADQARIVYAELKTATGRMDPEQRAWLTDLAIAGAETHIWRPADLFERRIAATLARRPQTPTDPDPTPDALPPATDTREIPT